MDFESIWAHGGASESVGLDDGSGVGKKSTFNWRVELTDVAPSCLSGHVAGNSQTVGVLKTV